MALRMTTMLLLLFLIAAVGSANGQQIVGAGKHTVNPDRTVKLAEGWNIATEKGSQPKGYQEYQCPIEIKENGDITVMYTKSGGGKTGCGLDLIAKKPANDVIRFTIAITTSDPSNTCLHNGSTAYNMLPFIHSVDNQEFQRMSKGGGWFGPDKGNCSKNDDPEQCKNNKGKYQCRKYTTYEFGWSFDEVEVDGKKEKKLLALVKPVAEPRLNKARNFLYFSVPFQPHTLIVTSKELQVEGADRDDKIIKQHFKCTPKPVELYPVISWPIASGEGTPLNGRHLLFFGLLAQDTKRDYFNNSNEDLPRCDLSLTFDGSHYELLHQDETFELDLITWLLIGIAGAGAVVIVVYAGVMVYCFCIKKDTEEEGFDEDAEKGKKKTPMVGPAGTKARTTPAAIGRGATGRGVPPPPPATNKQPVKNKINKKTKTANAITTKKAANKPTKKNVKATNKASKAATGGKKVSTAGYQVIK